MTETSQTTSTPAASAATSNPPASPAKPVGLVDAARLFAGRLNALRRKAKLFQSSLAGSLVGGTVTITALSTWAMDWTFRLEWGIRAVLLLGTIALVIHVGRKAMRLMGSPATDDALALALERAHPKLHDRLISAVQFLRGREAARGKSALPSVRPSDMPAIGNGRTGLTQALEDRVIVEAAGAVRTLPAAPLLRRAKLIRWLAIGGALVLTFAGTAVAWPEGAAVWFQRNVLLQNTEWPRYTHFEVTSHKGEEWLVPAGDPMRVNVRASGVLPSAVRGEVRAIGKDGVSEEVEEIEFAQLGEDTWQGYWPEVTGDFQLVIAGGDNTAGPFTVRAIPRPAVAAYQVVVTPPAYTNSRAYEVLPSAEIHAVRQSRIMITATASKPLSTVTAKGGTGSDLQVQFQPGSTTFACSMLVDESRTVVVTMADEHGFASAAPFELTLVADEDLPPTASLRANGLSDRITPIARLALIATAADQWGLTEGRLAISVLRGGVGGARDHRETQLPNTGIAGRDARWHPEAEVSGLEPDIGDFVAASLTVVDNNTLDGPGVTTSQPIQFRVVSPEELSAELLERLNGARIRFEELLREHKRNTARFVRWDEGHTSETDDLQREISDLASDQRRINDGAADVLQIYSALLRELWLNRLVKDSEFRSQQRQVVTPLETLLQDGLGPLRESLRMHALAARGGDEPPPTGTVETQYRRATTSMERILDAMQRLESFTEILNLLQGTHDALDRAHGATGDAIEDRTGQYLDDDDDDDDGEGGGEGG